jgi:large repetitive protein
MWVIRSVRRALFLVIALVVGLLASTAPVLAEPPADPAQTDAAKAKPVTQRAGGGAGRPDAVSAMVTARATGERVEDLSRRTETTTTWANPDGTITTEGHTGQIRFRDNAGKWRDVDLALERRADGTVAPKGHALDLRMAGATGRGGTDELITVSEHGGRSVALGWTGALPRPKVDGTTATYADVQPGVDLQVEALRSGFEQFFVLNERPSDAMSWQFPLRTKGLTARPEDDGSISFVDAKGTVRSTIPAAIAWDSQIDDRTGDHTDTSPVDLTVKQHSPGRATLTVTPDPEWLAAETTVYPVTVDPTYATAKRTTTFDTFVQQGYSTSQSTSTELKLGNNGSGQIARSFLKFELGSLKGKKIITAKLWLHAKHSWSCQTRYWQAWQVGGFGASTVWSNQPSWNEQISSSNQTKGYSSSCPNGKVSIGIKNLAQSWADSGAEVNRLGIRAANESDPYGWKKFASSETANAPYVEFTYNRVPGKPAVPTVAPAASYNSTLYTSDTTPKFTSKASDADGNTVKLTFEVHSSKTTSSSTLKASCTTGNVSQGSNASCSPGTALADNATYHVRARANDGFKDGSWSDWTTFKMAAAAPAMPVISCPGYQDGSWSSDLPGENVTCEITAAGTGTTAAGYIKYSVDGAATKRVQITQSSDPAVAKIDVTVSNKAGGHKIRAWAESPSGKVSSEARYSFGYGELGIDAPAAHPMQVTTGAVDIAASGPPTADSSLPAATLKWRVASSGEGEESGWNHAADLDVAADGDSGGLTITGQWDTMSAVRDEAAGLDLDTRVPVMLELQVCVAYAAGDQCTWFDHARTVLRVPHAFGEGFPVAEAGPGKVALWTGEFNTQVTDVTVPGYVEDLSISRSHSTYAGSPTAASGVFGPGWTAQLEGPDSGAAGFQVIDNTLLDGTIVMVAADGTPMIFGPNNLARRTTADIVTCGPDEDECSVEYVGVDDETGHLGVKAEVTRTGADTRFVFTDPDGVKTTFKVTKASTATTPAVFAPESVDEPGQVGQVTYSHDEAGRVTRILAPLPPGRTAGDCAEDGPLAPGCRALLIDYATTTTATPTSAGDVAGQVQSVKLAAYNPDKPGGPGMDTVMVAEYAYDSGKRLVSVTDPRPEADGQPALVTGYAYDGEGRLSEITPPGLAPYQLAYAGSPGKLATVTRDLPTGDGTASLATIIYGVPTSGAAGLPDLSETAVSEGWGQTKAPTYAAAVFGPDKPVEASDPAAVDAADWQYSSLWYTDERGYTLNTAQFGAGDWQLTHTGYDDHGHVILNLDAGDIAAIKNGELMAADAGTITTYNSVGNGPASTPAGAVVTDTYGPARMVTLSDGTQTLARPHTHTEYDQGAPEATNPDTGTGWRLPTTVTVQAVTPDETRTPLDAPVSVTKTEYGDLAGWTLGLPTKTIQVMGEGQPNIVRTTAYDAEGRVVETRQPASDGSDAGTRRTVYYTIDDNETHEVCGGQDKAQWAGLECLTEFAGPASTGQALPTTVTKGYSMMLQPALVLEKANGATRTTQTEYDAAGRMRSTRTYADDALAGSTGLPGTAYAYDPATGLQTTRTPIAADGTPAGDAEVTEYDSWGQVTSYSPADGETTTTTYDAAGRVSTISDPTGTRSYDYDGTDATGAAERRGVATRVTVSNPGGAAVTFAGAYNPDGTLTTQTLPGGLTQRLQVDAAGEPIGLTYSGQVTTVEEDGTHTVDPDGAWLAWSIDNDVLGRVVREYTPASSALTTGGLETGAAAGYSRQYSYDRAGRLTTVVDHTAPAGAGLDEETGELAGTVCETRAYDFDSNGNRTGLTKTGAQTDGSCAGSGGATTTWAYDAGDRLTTAGNGSGAYQYDAFSRATTIPAADTPAGAGAGALALGYFDNDSAASITQAGMTTKFTLDAAGRRATESTGPTGDAATETLVRHYTDTSDNPTWVEETVDGATSVIRYATGLDGDLAATIATNAAGAVSVALPLIDLHGDAVTTVEVPASSPAVGISTWVDHDEYGNPIGTDNGIAGTVTDGIGYGWLGGKTRATLSTGLILMGARLYNRVTGQFTSRDPIFGGGDTAYAYPNDPVNGFDLDGRHWYSSAWSWAKKNKATIATGVAVGVCFAASFGTCAVAAGIAFGARTVARARSGGGYRRTWRATAKDAIWTGATLGVGSAFKYATKSRYSYGFRSRPNPRALSLSRRQKAAVAVGSSAPAATYAYGRYRNRYVY